MVVGCMQGDAKLFMDKEAKRDKQFGEGDRVTNMGASGGTEARMLVVDDVREGSDAVTAGGSHRRRPKRRGGFLQEIHSG